MYISYWFNSNPKIELIPSISRRYKTQEIISHKYVFTLSWVFANCRIQRSMYDISTGNVLHTVIGDSCEGHAAMSVHSVISTVIP